MPEGRVLSRDAHGTAGEGGDSCAGRRGHHDVVRPLVEPEDPLVVDVGYPADLDGRGSGRRGRVRARVPRLAVVGPARRPERGLAGLEDGVEDLPLRGGLVAVLLDLIASLLAGGLARRLLLGGDALALHAEDGAVVVLPRIPEVVVPIGVPVAAVLRDQDTGSVGVRRERGQRQSDPEEDGAGRIAPRTLRAPGRGQLLACSSLVALRHGFFMSWKSHCNAPAGGVKVKAPSSRRGQNPTRGRWP